MRLQKAEIEITKEPNKKCKVYLAHFNGRAYFRDIVGKIMPDVKKVLDSALTDEPFKIKVKLTTVEGIFHESWKIDSSYMPKSAEKFTDIVHKIVNRWTTRDNKMKKKPFKEV